MERNAANGSPSVEQPKTRKEEVDVGGVIFATESAEHFDYFVHNRVGQASEEHFQYIRHVKSGMPVFFLLKGELFGIFEASQDGELVAQPEGRHYAQVRIHKQIPHPLSSDLFLPILGEGTTLETMKFQLTKQQAKSLKLTFSSLQSYPRRSLPSSNGYRGPPQNPRAPDSNWGYDRKPHYHPQPPAQLQPPAQPRPQSYPQPQPHSGQVPESRPPPAYAPEPYPPPGHDERRHPDGHYRPSPWRDMAPRGYPPPQNSHYVPPFENRGYGPRAMPMPPQPSYSYGYGYSHEEYRGAPGDYHDRWGDHPPPYGPPHHYRQPSHDLRRGPSHMGDYEHHREAGNSSQSPAIEPIEKHPVTPSAPMLDEEKKQLQEESQALKEKVAELERELAGQKLRSEEVERRLDSCENERTRIEELLRAKEVAYEKIQQEIQDVRAEMFSSYDNMNEIRIPQGTPPMQGAPPAPYSRPVSPASQGSYPPVHTGIPPHAAANSVMDHSHYHQHHHQANQSPRSDHRSQVSLVQVPHPASPQSTNPPSQLPRPCVPDDGELPSPSNPIQQGVQSSYHGDALPQPNPHQGTVPSGMSLPTPIVTGGAPAQHHQMSNAGFQSSVANFHGSQNNPSFSNPHASPSRSPNGSAYANGNPNGGNFSEGYGMGSGARGAGPPQSHQSESQPGYSQQYPNASEMEQVYTARPAASPQYSAPMRSLGPFDDNPTGLSR